MSDANKTCRRGHVYIAAQSPYGCPQCRAAAAATWQKAHPDALKRYSHAWYHSHRQQAMKATKRWIDNNPEFLVWSSMIQRCQNPKSSGYSDYGGRGIRVCKQWQGTNGFRNFLDAMGKRPEGLTLERVHNGKGYSPANCVWASRKIQQLNRRSVVWFKIGGIIMHQEAWKHELECDRYHLQRFFGHCLYTKPVSVCITHGIQK